MKKLTVGQLKVEKPAADMAKLLDFLGNLNEASSICGGASMAFGT